MSLQSGTLQPYGAYILDMDGTIYLGNELIPGAKEFLLAVRALDVPVRFLSNNPTRDRAMYVEKLHSLGISASRSEIITTIVTTVQWLKINYPNAVVFPISEQPLKNALSAAHIVMSDDPRRIDIVIASYDRTFEYKKLQIAFDAIWYHKKAFLITTNPDRYCPFPEGRGEPDAASIVAAIEACTGASLKYNMGKPSTIMIEAALQGIDIPAVNCLMVGDRISTDIVMAHNAGMHSALVLSGDSTISEVRELSEEKRPDFTVSSLNELISSSWCD